MIYVQMLDLIIRAVFIVVIGGILTAVWCSRREK